jgi:hypothetical protein
MHFIYFCLMQLFVEHEKRKWQMKMAK